MGVGLQGANRLCHRLAGKGGLGNPGHQSGQRKEKRKRKSSFPTHPLAGNEKATPFGVEGETHRINTPLGTTYVTINENGGEQPFEVFIHAAKAGSDTMAVSEAIGRLISYLLRLASPVTQRERLKEIVRQLSGIGGGRPLGFGLNRVLSLPDGVAQVLDNYLTHSPVIEKNGHHAHPVPKVLIGDLCPECGEAAVVNEEGCRKCYTCGYSEC